MKSVRIRSFSGPCSVRMWENTDQKNSEYGHFLRNEKDQQTFGFLTFSCMYRNGTLALIELSRYLSTIELFALVLLIIYFLYVS